MFNRSPTSVGCHSGWLLELGDIWTFLLHLCYFNYDIKQTKKPCMFAHRDMERQVSLYCTSIVSIELIPYGCGKKS